MDKIELREQMLQTQIISRGIKDKSVISAMRKVQRHEYIPPNEQASAYSDCPSPIGDGQTISQPYIVAYMTEALKLKASDRVLEIGTGSGYQSAILAELANEVVTIERIKNLSEQARKILLNQGYTNIDFITADGTRNFKEEMPSFDAIIITAATPKVPQHLLECLGDGGRLIAPVGSRDSQKLVLYTKNRDGYQKQELGACVFVPLIGEYGFS